MLTNHDRKDQHQLMVEVFMAQMRSDAQAIPIKPTIPSLAVRKLRAHLMLEECLETIRFGLGLDLFVSEPNLKLKHKDKIDFMESGRKPSFIHIADGLGDCRVVNDGTASAFGLAMRPFSMIVMANNLSKFGPGHSFNELGKLVKAPDFVGPKFHIMKELVEQGANADIDFGSQDADPE